VSILLKTNLICISILVVSGCLPFTIVGGVVGIGDSLDKAHRMNEIEQKIIQLESLLAKKDKPYQPYIPSYVDMETFKKGIYDK